MNMRFVSTKTYATVKSSRFTKVTGTWSQENVTFMGIVVDCSQPDMLSEDSNPEDMCWAVWPLCLLK